MNAAFRFLVVAVIALGFVFVATPDLLAQKDAISKSLGEHTVPFWSSRGSSRRLTHARDYVRDFHAYVAANPKPDPAVVKEVTKEIGANLEEAKKHLASLKRGFAADKDAVAGIEGLEKQLAAAFDQHSMLRACCEKENFEAIETMECCSDLASQLDKILSDHDALMRKLAAKVGAVAPAPKK